MKRVPWLPASDFCHSRWCLQVNLASGHKPLWCWEVFYPPIFWHGLRCPPKGALISEFHRVIMLKFSVLVAYIHLHYSRIPIQVWNHNRWGVRQIQAWGYVCAVCCLISFRHNWHRLLTFNEPTQTSSVHCRSLRGWRFAPWWPSILQWPDLDIYASHTVVAHNGINLGAGERIDHFILSKRWYMNVKFCDLAKLNSRVVI